MWVFTQHSYVSIVKKGRRGHFMVRGRDKVSLELFCERAGVARNKIYQDLPSDYPWRAQLKPREVKRALAREVDELDYPNFKGRATKSRGRVYHDMLSAIWSLTHRLEDPADKAKNNAAWDRKYPPRKWDRAGSILGGQTRYIDPEPVKDKDDIDADWLEQWDKAHGWDLSTMPIADMTETQWREWCTQNPGGI